MHEPLDIVAALAVARRRGWIVVLAVLLAVAGAAFVTSRQRRVYKGTATLFVSGIVPATHTGTVDPVATSVELTNLAQQSAVAYAQLAGSRPVTADTAAALGLPLDQVAGHIQADAQPGVQLIHLSADAPTGVQAAQLANAAAAALATHAPGLGNHSAGGLQMSIADPAQAPSQPVSPRVQLNLLLGALVGLVLGLALAAVRERLDRRIRSATDVGEVLGLPLLGELPRLARRMRRRSAVDQHAIPRVADPYRTLASAITVATGEEQRRILVTSPAAKDGKTTVAAHLALALAEDGEQTVLMEGDLHRPSQHRVFPQASRQGLSELLSATNGSLPAVAEVRPGLKVLAATEVDVREGLSIRNPGFAHAIEVAAEHHERVVLDSPPILGPADAALLARKVDAAVLVLAAGRTREEDALAAVAALNRLGAQVLGVVLSRVRVSRRKTAYYGFGPAERRAVRDLRVGTR